MAWCFGTGLLIVFSALLISTARQKSLVFDEIVYAPIGYLEWKTGDLRWNSEHPPLQKLASSLFWTRQKINIPSDLDPLKDDPYRVGFGLFFSDLSKSLKLIFLSRLPTIILSSFLALFLFIFAKSILGPKAALISLGVLVLDPLVIANGCLALNDMFVTVFFFAAAAVSWNNHNNRRWLVVVSGTLAGLAIGSKLSGLLVIPVCLLISTIRNKPSFRQATENFCLLVLLCFVTLLLLYRFNTDLIFEAFHKTKHLNQGIVNHGFLLKSFSGYIAWFYYPVALLIKTPLALLAFWLFSFTVLIRRRHESISLVPALIAIAFVFGAAMLTRNHFGLRYILPAIPFLALSVGEAFSFLKKRNEKIIWIFLLCWLGYETVTTHPDHMAYFNQLVGGSEQGYKWLDGSNQDWGQDLPALAQFLEKENQPALYLSYFGSNDPAAWGIEYQDVFSPALISGVRSPHLNQPNVSHEFFAVSARLMADPQFEELFGWLKKNRKPQEFLGSTLFIYDFSNDREAIQWVGLIYQMQGRSDFENRQKDRLKALS